MASVQQVDWVPRTSGDLNGAENHFSDEGAELQIETRYRRPEHCRSLSEQQPANGLCHSLRLSEQQHRKNEVLTGFELLDREALEEQLKKQFKPASGDVSTRQELERFEEMKLQFSHVVCPKCKNLHYVCKAPSCMTALGPHYDQSKMCYNLNAMRKHSDRCRKKMQQRGENELAEEHRGEGAAVDADAGADADADRDAEVRAMEGTAEALEPDQEQEQAETELLYPKLQFATNWDATQQKRVRELCGDIQREALRFLGKIFKVGKKALVYFVIKDGRLDCSTDEWEKRMRRFLRDYNAPNENWRILDEEVAVEFRFFTAPAHEFDDATFSSEYRECIVLCCACPDGQVGKETDRLGKLHRADLAEALRNIRILTFPREVEHFSFSDPSSMKPLPPRRREDDVFCGGEKTEWWFDMMFSVSERDACLNLEMPLHLVMRKDLERLRQNIILVLADTDLDKKLRRVSFKLVPGSVTAVWSVGLTDGEFEVFQWLLQTCPGIRRVLHCSGIPLQLACTRTRPDWPNHFTMLSENLVCRIYRFAPEHVVPHMGVCKLFKKSLLQAEEVVLRIPHFPTSSVDWQGLSRHTGKIVLRIGGFGLDAFKFPSGGRDGQLSQFPALMLQRLEVENMNLLQERGRDFSPHDRSIVKGIVKLDLMMSVGFNLAHLAHLQLCNTKLSTGGLAIVARWLSLSSGVSTLRLASNNICDEGVDVLAVGLKGLSSLAELDMSSNFLGDAGVRQLLRSLPRGSLRVLNLPGNRFKAVDHNLLSRFTTLEELDLSENDLDQENRNMCIAGLIHCCMMKHLNLSHAGLSRAFASTYYTSACNAMTSLQQLNRIPVRCDGHTYCLNGCKIQLFELELASLVLESCAGLHSLHMSGCGMDDEVAASLAARLSECAQLQCLDVSNNHLSCVGLKDIAQGLSCCTSLAELLLDHNRIGVDGAKLLCRALASWPCLVSLQLSGNRVTQEAAQALTLHAQRHSELHSHFAWLDLTGQVGVACGTPADFVSGLGALLLEERRWHPFSVPRAPTPVRIFPPVAAGWQLATAPQVGDQTWNPVNARKLVERAHAHALADVAPPMVDDCTAPGSNNAPVPPRAGEPSQAGSGGAGGLARGCADAHGSRAKEGRLFSIGEPEGGGIEASTAEHSTYSQLAIDLSEIMSVLQDDRSAAADVSTTCLSARSDTVTRLAEGKPQISRLEYLRQKVKRLAEGDVLDGDQENPDTLGRGAQATVEKGSFCGSQVALKVYSAKRGESKMKYVEERALTEAVLLHQITNDPVGAQHVVRCHGVRVVTAGSFYEWQLVLELAPQGSLAPILYDPKWVPAKVPRDGIRERSPYIERRRLGWLRGISKALEFLHDHTVTHCDVKASNVLLFCDGREPKLADFGCCVQGKGVFQGTVSYATVHNAGYTERYVAPERRDASREITCSADVWSFGLLAFEILFGEKAWQSIQDDDQDKLKQVQRAISLTALRPAVLTVLDPCEVMPHVVALVQRCWALRPADRPKMADVVEALEPGQFQEGFFGTEEFVRFLDSELDSLRKLHRAFQPDMAAEWFEDVAGCNILHPILDQSQEEYVDSTLDSVPRVMHWGADLFEDDWVEDCAVSKLLEVELPNISDKKEFEVGQDVEVLWEGEYWKAFVKDKRLDPNGGHSILISYVGGEEDEDEWLAPAELSERVVPRTASWAIDISNVRGKVRAKALPDGEPEGAVGRYATRTAKFQVNDRVRARYRNGSWYDAVIVERVGPLGDSFRLKWDDGGAKDRVKHWQDLRHYDPDAAFQVGDEVLGLYGDGNWYEAEVVDMVCNGSQIWYKLRWADGDTADTRKTEKELQLKPASMRLD